MISRLSSARMHTVSRALRKGACARRSRQLRRRSTGRSVRRIGRGTSSSRRTIRPPLPHFCERLHRPYSAGWQPGQRPTLPARPTTMLDNPPLHWTPATDRHYVSHHMRALLLSLVLVAAAGCEKSKPADRTGKLEQVRAAAAKRAADGDRDALANATVIQG